MKNAVRCIAILFTVLILWQDASTLESSSPLAIPQGYNTSLSREEIFNLANEYYRNGNLEKALDGYLYLADLGVSNGFLFYNLGNTFFRIGYLGKSILWYERAFRYLPRNEDLQRNYEYAKNNLLDEEFQVSDYGGTVGFLIDLHETFNLRESLLLTLTLLWLLVAVAIAMLLWKSQRVRNLFKIPCWIVAIAFTLSILSTGLKIYHHEFVKEAIVISSAVEVKTGPGETFSTSFSIHEGTKVRVVQDQEEWKRIVLPGNTSFNGWVMSNTIEII